MQLIPKTKPPGSLIPPFLLAAGLGLLLLFPFGTSAGSDCQGTTLEMAACLEKDYKQLDSKLSNLYKRVSDGLAPSPKKGGSSQEASIRDLFMKAHKTWLSFRDEECKARQGYFSDGSMGKLESLGCRIELTEERIKSLENWLELLER